MAVLDNTIYLLYASGSYFSQNLIMIAFILCFYFAASYLHVIEKYLSQTLPRKEIFGFFVLKMSDLFFFKRISRTSLSCAALFHVC